MKTNSHLYKASRISRLAYLVTALTWAAVAHAQFISLSSNSLPTNQGWTFVSTLLIESDVFVADGTALTQTTVGTGSEGASYRMDGIINLNEEMTLSLTARVLAYERLGNGSTGLGFNFILRDEAGDYRLAMTDTEVIVNGQGMALDTTVYHEYFLSMHPDGTFDLDIDGARAFSGTSGANPGTNRLIFGDTTDHENTDAELTSMRIEWVTRDDADIAVQKSVNNAFPAANEPVEFTVEVSNIGGTDANDVLVIDMLPAAMEIPNGTAAFSSIGDYDPATGEWNIGQLTNGTTAILTVPAVITADEAPGCGVNIATSQFSDLGGDDNDESRAVVYQQGTDRCVDLYGTSGVETLPGGFLAICNNEAGYSGSIDVTNNGPDDARNITVTISQAPLVGAAIRFDDDACEQSGSDTCVVSGVVSGESLLLNVTSDAFHNHSRLTQVIDISVTTTDQDYDSSNNLTSFSMSVLGFSSCDAPIYDLDLDFGSIGPGCFIATAAYGTTMHPHLDGLRNFRDRFMITNGPGRALVNFYYRYSPPIADYIAERGWLRRITRGLLAPIVYTVIYPAQAAMLLLGFSVLVAARRRRTKTT